MLGEIERWRACGLIDEATRQRLALLYWRDAALERELDEQAQFHLEMERRAEAARAFRHAAWQGLGAVPVSERASKLVEAARAAARDVASVDFGPPPAPPEAKILERESAWSALLRPFLYEHAPWIAGGLLVLFGSLYFLSSIWYELSSVPLRAVITAALHVYAAAFAGVALVLGRREAFAASRALICFALGLLPLGSVALGELSAALLSPLSPGGVLLALLAVALSLGAQAALLWVGASLFERRAAAPLALGGSALLVLTAAAAPLSAVPSAGVVLASAGLLVFAAGARRIARRVRWSTAALLALGTGAWALAVLALRVGHSLAAPATHWAPLVAAAAAVLVGCDRELRARAGFAPRLGGVALALHVALLACVLVSLFGLVRQGYLDGGARVTLVLTSALALWVFARSAREHGRSALTHGAAGAGLLVYFFCPSLFGGLLELVASSAGRALGYEDRPLPLAFYGLAVLPYLAMTAALAGRLRRNRLDLARDLGTFSLVLAAGVSLLALSAPEDLRAALWSWPVYAAGAYALSRWLGRRAVYLGHVLATGTLAAAGITAERAGIFAPPGVLLAAGGLAAAMFARRGPRHLAHAALLAIAAGACSLGLPETRASAVALTLAVSSPALALVALALRSVLAARAAAFTLLAACASGCIALEASAASTFVALCASALSLIATARLGRASILAGPAKTAATLSLLAAFTLGLAIAPAWGAVAALLLGVAAAVAASPLLAGLAAASTAAAVALAAGDLFSPALAGSACVLLGIAAVLRARAPRQATAVAWVAAAAALIGGELSALRALPGQPDAALWGLYACAGALAFSACTVWAYRRAWPDLAAVALGPGALALALAASFGIEVVATLDASAALWVHLTSLAATAGLLALFGRVGRTPALSAMSRAASFALLVVVVCAVLLAPVVALFRCSDPTELFALGRPALAALAAFVALASLAVVDGERRRRQLWLALGAAGITLLWLGAVGGHASVPVLAIAAAGVALRWRRARLFGAPPELGCVVAACGLGLVGGHLHAARPESFVALALSAAVLLREQRARAEAPSWLGTAGASLAVLAAQALTLLVAARLSTGRYPAAAVLAPMAAAALVSGVALRGAGARSGRSIVGVAHAALALAAALAACGVAACAPAVPALVSGLGLAVLLLSAVLLLRWGVADQRPFSAHAAVLVVPVAYLVARAETPLSAFGAAFDAGSVVLAAHAAFWLGRALAPRPVVARALAFAARLWPLGGLWVVAELSLGGVALFTFAIALHYSVLARIDADKRFAVVAALFGNASLFASYALLGAGSLLAYALPLGLTALVLVHVYAAELGDGARQRLRVLILGALYAVCGAGALAEASPLQALVVVPALSVLGIVLGVVLRVRAYLVMSTAFLALDLLLQMVRYGLQSRPLGALFLTLLGLALVGAMVAFSLERERILRRYAGFVGELRRWE